MAGNTLNLSNSEEIQFPSGGYPNLHLDEVFEVHGPIHGITELNRRSNLPPTATIDAEIIVDVMKRLGQLTPLADVDYCELTH